MQYDHSLEALIKPGNADHFFQFDRLPPVYINSNQFETATACLLIELCRLIYRNDQIIHCGNDKISFIQTILNKVHIELVDCFKDDQHAVYSWLLKINALDVISGKSSECLLLIFRGSNGFDNWRLNTDAAQISHHHHGKVHRGFYSAFQSIETKLKRSDLLQQYPLILAGHSLGAALALLTNSELGKNITIDSCYTFGSPKIGDETFTNSLTDEQIYRVVYRNDIVTMLPFDFLTTQYCHVGESHFFTNQKHFVSFKDNEILEMQQQDLNKLKDVNSLDKFLFVIKNLEKDIPTYLSDHAPVNYLTRLKQAWLAELD